MTEYLSRRCEALERQVELLKAAIKETWSFVSYDLPLSLEIEVQSQPSLADIDWNRKVFLPILKIVKEESLKILKEANEPVHFSVIVEAVKRNHKPYLKEAWTRHTLGDKANLAGKVRDLATEGILKRVAKGMYFFGPKLAVNCKEKQQP